MKFIDREGIGVGTTMTSVSPTSMSQKVPRNEQEVQLSQKDRACLMSLNVSLVTQRHSK